MESPGATPKPDPGLPYLDVVAVLCLAVLPALVYSIMALTNPGATSDITIQQDMFLLIIRSIQVSIPILLIMHLRAIKWADYGFVEFRPVRDLVIGGMLTALGLFIYYVVAYGLHFAGFGGDGAAETSAQASLRPEYTLATLFLILTASIANGFAEELAMRSYLIPRLTELTRSPLFAVIATSVLFSSYHLYQGVSGVIYTLLLGLALGTYFHITKRFWPIMIAHAFLDAIPYTLSLQNAG